MKKISSISLSCLAALWLAACSSTAPPPTPTPLSPVAQQINVRLAWSASLGEVDAHLRVALAKGLIATASSEGHLQVLQLKTGAPVWTAQARPVSAGIGFDGERLAYLNDQHEVEVWQKGQRLWVQPIAARSFTPPLVAGQRVFVLTADRQLYAFDGATGTRLWVQTGWGDPLVLKAPTLLAAWGDRLLVGWGDRLVNLDPLTGRAQWDVMLTTLRGTNEIERLRDVVAGVYARDNLICARAFQTAVTCVDSVSRRRVWSVSRDGTQGVAGNANTIVATDAASKVIAWNITDGKEQWIQEALMHRKVTAPSAFQDQWLMVGDSEGWVHWLDAKEGQIKARMSTDGTPLLSAPLVVDQMVIGLTQGGRLYVWQMP